MRLGFLVDVKGNVPVKVIARTFASGKSISSGQLFLIFMWQFISILHQLHLINVFIHLKLFIINLFHDC